MARDSLQSLCSWFPRLPLPSSANPRVQGRADVIRPQYDGQYAPPERKVQKADRKQPADDPQASGKTMLFDLDFFHISLLLRHLPAVRNAAQHPALLSCAESN